MRKHEKTIAKSLDNIKQIIGQPWDNHGKHKKTIRKTIGQPWEKHFKKTLENH